MQIDCRSTQPVYHNKKLVYKPIYYTNYLPKGAFMRLLSILLLSGSISLLAAQTKQVPAPAAAKPAQKKVAAPATEKIMEGMLVSVDKTKMTLIINLRGKEYDFKVTSATAVTINNASASFDKVTAGSGVHVTYSRDNKGDRVVKTLSQSIAMKPAKSAVAAKPVPAKPVAATKPAPAATKPAVPAPPAPAKPAPAAAPAPVAAKPAPAPATAPVAAKPAPAAAAPTPAPAAAKPAPAPAPVAAKPAPAAAAPAPATAKPAPAPAPVKSAPAPSPVAPKAAPAGK